MAPIRRLLIANRGEIVVRVARTAKAVGIETVAIASASDEGSPHTRACDLTISIGGDTPAESYLRGEKVLEAARLSGADAIHPGYGFLSENAEFAGAVAAAGLIWVGPPAESIRAMGDKARARIRAAAAGLPVTPGYDGEDQALEVMVREAERIGYPVMVKASAGGGGRGMRLVGDPAGLSAALASAASEAGKAFGDPRLLLEKAIVAPRHVEVQIFADAQGGAVHLFERDCSVQRRHQKVIEEAPSPVVDDALRHKMGAAAVSIARDIGYVGAGTVEFLLDRDSRFYFMEMNTRLQVEHPVTEMITGVDLVDWQLRIAAGESLPLTQDQIRIDGCAIEARLCAEDPALDYMPRTGGVLVWRESEGARNDHALSVGQEVTPFFDSMLGKIIVRGRTRAEACQRLQSALDSTVLLGIPTNRLLLGRIVRDEVFRAGVGVSTAFLSERFPEAGQRMATLDDEAWAIAAWLSAVAEPERWRTPAGWRDWSSATAFLAPWRLRLEQGGETEERRGTAQAFPGGARIASGELHWEIEGAPAAEGQAFVANCRGLQFDVVHAWNGDRLWVRLRPLARSDAEAVEFSALSLRRRPPDSDRKGSEDRTIVSPMNGRVVNVHAAVGATVSRGQTLVVIEAMKMEHNLTAPSDGRVQAIHVKPGDQVPPKCVLIELEALEATP